MHNPAAKYIAIHYLGVFGVKNAIEQSLTLLSRSYLQYKKSGSVFL